MAKKTNLELERVSINIPSNIVTRVKQYADSRGINYTSAYIILLNQALDQTDILSQMPLMYNLLNDVKQLANSNIIQVDNNDKQ